MFKRMSTLVRRPDHDRATFSRLWERHAAPVSGLPRVRGYIQNHIEEEFSAAAPIRADGFVELLWDSPEDMAAAFAAEAAKPMVEDEPRFLGHGSGYALHTALPLRDMPGGKLILAVLGDDVAAIQAEAADLAGLTASALDTVSSLIAKPGMTPPQPVDAFLHLWFGDLETARTAALRLATRKDMTAGIYRVRTIRFV